jgi:hypothetical protein
MHPIVSSSSPQHEESRIVPSNNFSISSSVSSSSSISSSDICRSSSSSSIIISNSDNSSYHNNIPNSKTLPIATTPTKAAATSTTTTTTSIAITSTLIEDESRDGISTSSIGKTLDGDEISASVESGSLAHTVQEVENKYSMDVDETDSNIDDANNDLNDETTRDVSDDEKITSGTTKSYLTTADTAIVETNAHDEGSKVPEHGDRIASTDRRHETVAGDAMEETKVSRSNGGDSRSTHGDTGLGRAVPSNVNPPPPVMKGTLCYDVDQRRHLIRGMWNYENSAVFPPQRFELLRNLGPEEELTKLPQDGEFHGSFSLVYFHTTSKGKQKERSKVIPETGVLISFTPLSGSDGKESDNGSVDEYQVDGTGNNQFGVFHINGTASRTSHAGDPTFNVVLRKRYEAVPIPAAEPAAQSNDTTDAITSAHSASTGTADKKLPTPATVDEGEALPPPSPSYPSGVVCLRGHMLKEESNDLGITEVVHRINGMWASGLDFILADPQNVRGLCNRFEYEHKSSVSSNTFPVSGRYSGWFDLSNDDGTRTRINERDVTLKFRKNNAGYHNVEGRGSNVFGKYSITGTLTLDYILTIFRHFQHRKIKTKPPESSVPGDVTTSVSENGTGSNGSC